MRFTPGHFLECRNGVFGSQWLDIRSGLGTKLQAPVEKKYLSWVYGADRKFHHSGSQLGITPQAS